MAKPKHDYDSEDFYKRIEGLAMNGYTDSEIANELNLSADVFGSINVGTRKKISAEVLKLIGS